MPKISLEPSHRPFLHRELQFLRWGRWFSYLLFEMMTDSNDNRYKTLSGRRWFVILKWKATYLAVLSCVTVYSVPQKVDLISESVGEI